MPDSAAPLARASRTRPEFCQAERVCRTSQATSGGSRAKRGATSTARGMGTIASAFTPLCDGARPSSYSGSPWRSALPLSA